MNLLQKSTKTNLFAFLLLFFFVVFASAQHKTHTVQKGDTVYSLSKKYKMSASELISLNRLPSSASISIGQVLKVKGKKETSSAGGNSSSSDLNLKNWKSYCVKKGDTLYSLARGGKIAVSQLLMVNKLPSNAIIKVGQILKVPVDFFSVPSLPIIKTPPVIVEVNLSARGIALSRGNLSWPVTGKLFRYNGKIKGVEIESGQGEPVVSISSGEVSFSDLLKGFGKTVIIKNPSGYTYVYCGNEQLFVEKGDLVRPGSRIGSVGYHSHDKSSKVILCIRKDNRYVDPLKAPRN